MPEMMTGFGLKVIVGPVVGSGSASEPLSASASGGNRSRSRSWSGCRRRSGVGVGVGLAVACPLARPWARRGRDVGGVDEALPPDPLHCANMTERAAMTQSVERESVRFTRASFTKRRVDA